jgi:hypothetical protein
VIDTVPNTTHFHMKLREVLLAILIASISASSAAAAGLA